MNAIWDQIVLVFYDNEGLALYPQEDCAFACAKEGASTTATETTSAEEAEEAARAGRNVGRRVGGDY